MWQVCDAAVGNVYPVIENPDDPDPARSLKGRPQVQSSDPIGAKGTLFGANCESRFSKTYNQQTIARTLFYLNHSFGSNITAQHTKCV